MVTVPAALPVTLPLASIVATVLSLEVHVPPLVASVSVMMLPAQTVLLPRIGAVVGGALTVTVVVWLLEQMPFVMVYVMVTVPTALPVTLPAASIVAIVLSLEVQVPPLVASVNVIVLPAQTILLPRIGTVVGVALTATVA